MREYVKNNNTLSPIKSSVRVYTDVSCIPNNFQGIAIVENDGVYNVNGQTQTLLLSNKPTNMAGFTVGEVVPFIGNTIPNGFLECNGQQFSTSLYPELYSLLGTDYTPDFRETYPVGGSTVGVYSDDSIYNHTHCVYQSHRHRVKCSCVYHSHGCVDTPGSFSWNLGVIDSMRQVSCCTSSSSSYRRVCPGFYLGAGCSITTVQVFSSGERQNPGLATVTVTVGEEGTSLYTAPNRYLVKYLIYAGE